MTEISETKSKFSVKGITIGCGALFLGFVILVLLALGIYVGSLLITLEPDEVAVVLSPYEPNGIRENPLTPGKHMLQPLDRLEIFNSSREKYLSSSTDCNCGSSGSRSAILRTKDGAEILIDYQVTYSINPNQVVKLYQVWQHRYQDRFVIPQSKKITEEIASQYNSDEIALTKRDEIEQTIFSRLKSDFLESNLVLFEFKIDDVRLNK